MDRAGYSPTPRSVLELFAAPTPCELLLMIDARSWTPPHDDTTTLLSWVICNCPPEDGVEFLETHLAKTHKLQRTLKRIPTKTAPKKCCQEQNCKQDEDAFPESAVPGTPGGKTRRVWESRRPLRWIFGHTVVAKWVHGGAHQELLQGARLVGAVGDHGLSQRLAAGSHALPPPLAAAVPVRRQRLNIRQPAAHRRRRRHRLLPRFPFFWPVRARMLSTTGMPGSAGWNAGQSIALRSARVADHTMPPPQRELQTRAHTSALHASHLFELLPLPFVCVSACSFPASFAAASLCPCEAVPSFPGELAVSLDFRPPISPAAAGLPASNIQAPSGSMRCLTGGADMARRLSSSRISRSRSGFVCVLTAMSLI